LGYERERSPGSARKYVPPDPVGFFNALDHANFLNPNWNCANSLMSLVASDGPRPSDQVGVKFLW